MTLMPNLLACALLALLPVCADAEAARASVQSSDVEPLDLRIAVTSDGHANYFVHLLEESLKLIHQPHVVDAGKRRH
jgi:hypothetical protein